MSRSSYTELASYSHLYYNFNDNVLALMRPLFDDVTVNEGDLLELICATDDTLPTTSTHVQSPISVPRRLPNNSPIISIPNVTRDFAGTYTCIITDESDDSVVNETSEVVIQCKFPIQKVLYNYIILFIVNGSHE